MSTTENTLSENMGRETEEGEQTNKSNENCTSSSKTELSEIESSSAYVELEGNQMAMLRNAVSKTIKKCLSAGRFKLFVSNFGPVAKKHPKALKSLHQQFLQQLEYSMDEEVSKLYEEENVPSLMNKLEDLTIKSDPSNLAWRPSGNVEEDVRAHIYPLKLKQRDRLKKMVETLEDENKHLRQAVEARRKKFLATRKVILDHASEINMAHAACEEFPLAPFLSFLQP